MRRLAAALLASSAIAVVAGGTALAADLPPRPAYKAPPPVVAPYSWTGFYIGAHFGGAWSRKEWKEPSTFGTSPFNDFCVFDGFGCLALRSNQAGSHNGQGPLAGGQIGYNFQAGYVLFGVEAQFSWARLKGDHQNTTSSAISGCEFDGFCTLLSSTHSDRFFSKVNSVGTIAARIGLI